MFYDYIASQNVRPVEFCEWETNRKKYQMQIN